LLDTSVFHHVTPAPAADPNWTAACWLTGLGLLGAVLGIAAFRRRDLASA
jgi:ABC-2 type transport system permease protein